MRRKALQLLVVCCLVALAGCSGALPGGDGAQSVDDVTYPAGVSENGTNLTALADAHQNQLQNQSLTLEVASTVNSSMGNQSVALDAAVGADREQIRVNGSAMGQNVSVFVTEEKRYTRLNVGDGEARYQIADRSPDSNQIIPASYTGRSYLDRFAGSGNFTPTGVRTVDGTTLVVLEADGSNATQSSQANVTDYNATMLVDQQGVVHSVSVEASVTRQGQRVRTDFTMNVSDVGETTVAEPTWLDEARNSTNS
ncbi:hypothetical protein M0R88_05385 [Halorussus gelatinilyticus]|uniref:Uncharacterized protein n=1 Tax=Halorussus gelatinilyticus TaxID=2937524 RepID=A0A8U0IK69_9EURY|nr:hypothetical protein [Halorussus gelatinilyticus]UPW01537.1 hypothetical protein M0R88_05385 [Halorussus gelatinilyticus]